MKSKRDILLFLFCIAIILCYAVANILSERGFDEISKTKLEQLHKQNPDCIGWIKIEGTKINYPVMQTKKQGGEFYLRRDFNKKYSLGGTPFLDKNSKLGLSQNYVIYGHNIQWGTMFNALLDYQDEEFFEEHRFVTFENIKEGKQAYEVICAFKTELYTFNVSGYTDIEDHITLGKYVKRVNRKNMLNTTLKADMENQLLTLSTCSYHVLNGKGRFVIVAKRIDKE